jgi:hypothetical protein
MGWEDRTRRASRNPPAHLEYRPERRLSWVYLWLEPLRENTRIVNYVTTAPFHVLHPTVRHCAYERSWIPTGPETTVLARISSSLLIRYAMLRTVVIRLLQRTETIELQELPSRCVVITVSAALLWLHCSSFRHHVPCHKFVYKLL